MSGSKENDFTNRDCVSSSEEFEFDIGDDGHVNLEKFYFTLNFIENALHKNYISTQREVSLPILDRKGLTIEKISIVTVRYTSLNFILCIAITSK